MGASADFFAESAHRVNFDNVLIFAVKYTRCALRPCLFDGHFFADDFDACRNGFVDGGFDGFQFVRGQRAGEVEVKPQTFGGDVAALLLYPFVAQNLFERGEQKVGRGVQTRRLFGVVGKAALEFLFGARLGFLLMLFEARFVSRFVHRNPVVAGEFQRHFDGESVGVVQLERRFAAHAIVLNIFEELVKFFQSLLKRCRKPRDFFFEFVKNARAVFAQFGVGFFVKVDVNSCAFGQNGGIELERARKAQRATDQAAQNISLIDVGRRYAFFVPQHKGCGADVVGDDAHALEAVGDIGGFLIQQFHYGAENVGFVNGFKAVEHCDGAFEPHTGVDVFLGEGEERAVRLFVVFHKDVVPDFDILAAVASGGAGLGAGGNVADDKYFGVGSARSGDAGGSPPVVLFGQIENTVACDAVRSPAVGAELVARSVLVAGKDRYRNPSGVDAQDLGQEAIGEVDAFLFEVIAERPVAEHFEEGAVRGVADVVDVTGTDALLDVGKAGALGVFGAEQIGDQGVHPRRRKQDGRIVVGDQRRAADDGVPVAAEEVKILLTKLFCSNHRYLTVEALF